MNLFIVQTPLYHNEYDNLKTGIIKKEVNDIFSVISRARHQIMIVGLFLNELIVCH